MAALAETQLIRRPKVRIAIRMANVVGRNLRAFGFSVGDLSRVFWNDSFGENGSLCSTRKPSGKEENKPQPVALGETDLLESER